eukprot:9109822-Pyramimonas_sp.AAC.1
MPVHVVEEALTDSARANYFESSPQQAVAWRTAAPWWARPCNLDAWLAKDGLEDGAGVTEKQHPPPDAEAEADQHDPVVAGERPNLLENPEQRRPEAPSEGPPNYREEGPDWAPKKPRLGVEMSTDPVGSASRRANIAIAHPLAGSGPQKPLGNPGTGRQAAGGSSA